MVTPGVRTVRIPPPRLLKPETALGILQMNLTTAPILDYFFGADFAPLFRGELNRTTDLQNQLPLLP